MVSASARPLLAAHLPGSRSRSPPRVAVIWVPAHSHPCSDLSAPSSRCSDHSSHSAPLLLLKSQAHAHRRVLWLLVGPLGILSLISLRCCSDVTILRWLSLNILKVASSLSSVSPPLSYSLLSMYYCWIHSVLFCLLFTFCIPTPPLA